MFLAPMMTAQLTYAIPPALLLPVTALFAVLIDSLCCFGDPGRASWYQLSYSTEPSSLRDLLHLIIKSTPSTSYSEVVLCLCVTLWNFNPSSSESSLELIRFRAFSSSAIRKSFQMISFLAWANSSSKSLIRDV